MIRNFLFIVFTGDWPVEMKLMKINRFPVGNYFPGEESLKEAMDRAHETHLDMRDALSLWTMSFFKRAKEERRAVRNEILSGRDPCMVHQFINTSKKVLTRVETTSGVSLLWHEIWYAEGSKTQGKRKPRYNYINKTKAGGYSMATLIKGAHPDEFEILERHEKERRALEEAWRNLHRLERDLKVSRRQIVRE